MTSPQDKAGADQPNQARIRDERGRVLPGASLNPSGVNAGRPKLPDWFKARGPDALRVLVAQATGEVLPQDDGTVLPAVAQVAVESSPKERLAAAEVIADRVYGKAPATVEVEGEVSVKSIIRKIVDPTPTDNG